MRNPLGGLEMRKTLFIICAAIWFFIGATGAQKMWLDSGLDITLETAPVVYIVGGALGPIMWIGHGWGALNLDEIVLVKAP